MSAPEFPDLPLYTYKGAQINLIQYANILSPSGQGFFPILGYNERFNYSFSAGNSNSVQFKDSVDITPDDFANTSMLAKDMKNSLGKTLAVFTSHFVYDIGTPALYTGASIDSSVGQYSGPGEFGNVTINCQTFDGGVPSFQLFGFVTVTSFLNNLRT